MTYEYPTIENFDPYGLHISKKREATNSQTYTVSVGTNEYNRMLIIKPERRENKFYNDVLGIQIMNTCYSWSPSPSEYTA